VKSSFSSGASSSHSSSSSSSSSASASSSSIKPSGLGSSATVQNGGDIEDRLWVDKYKPARFDEVIGSTETAKKLVEWLNRWDAVHLKKNQKVTFSKENPGAKAVLLSGPPGIGKTTVATLAARQLGYETLELNASDARSKKAITEQVADVVLSQAMSSDGNLRKRLVIMDEVDGMGGSDRGGIPELIKVYLYIYI
jgi:replication factor C subunit 1